jgi:hypothetical protein
MATPANSDIAASDAAAKKRVELRMWILSVGTAGWLLLSARGYLERSLVRPISIIFLFCWKLQLELQTMMRRTIRLGIQKLNGTLSARS